MSGEGESEEAVATSASHCQRQNSGIAEHGILQNKRAETGGPEGEETSGDVKVDGRAAVPQADTKGRSQACCVQGGRLMPRSAHSELSFPLPATLLMSLANETPEIMCC